MGDCKSVKSILSKTMENSTKLNEPTKIRFLKQETRCEMKEMVQLTGSRNSSTNTEVSRLVINESPKIVISGGPKHLQQHHHHHHHHKHRTPPNNQPQVAITVSGSSVCSCLAIRLNILQGVAQIFAIIPWEGGGGFLDKISRGRASCVLLLLYKEGF